MVGSQTLTRRLLGAYLPLAGFLLFLLFPFYWMLVVSVKPTNDLFNAANNPFWVQHFTLENYAYLFQKTAFLSWLQNTLIVSVSATAISLFCSVLIGYALARLRFPGSNFLGVAIFLAYLVPDTLLFLPLSQVIAKLGLYNTYWALILTYPTRLIPFASWLLMGYFKTIPKEIEECAMIDGVSRLGGLTKIILPLALPGVLSAGIFSFTLSWNEFLYALIFISELAQAAAQVVAGRAPSPRRRSGRTSPCGAPRPRAGWRGTARSRRSARPSGTARGRPSPAPRRCRRTRGSRPCRPATRAAWRASARGPR